MDIHAKLDQLGLQLPPAPRPIADYVPAVRSGGLIFVSGQLPMLQGGLMATGPVASAVRVDQAQAAAQQCALNALAIIDGELNSDWSTFVRVVRLGVFVLSDDDFTDQPKVANAASGLLGQLLGQAGRHARTAVGVNALPLGATVELELVVEAAAQSGSKSLTG